MTADSSLWNDSSVSDGKAARLLCQNLFFFFSLNLSVLLPPGDQQCAEMQKTFSHEGVKKNAEDKETFPPC